MRLKKFLGGFLFGIGCVVALIGLLCAVLPMIDNDQLRLVLSSFEMPSQNPIINLINGAMRYSLANCYLVMLVGAGVLALGAIVMLFARRDEPQEEYEEYTPRTRRPAAYAVADDDARVDPPVWRPEPVNEEPNPFADASIAELLKPRAAAQPAAPAANPFADPALAEIITPKVVAKPAEAPINPYAAPILPRAEDAAASPYQRPKTETEASADAPAPKPDDAPKAYDAPQPTATAPASVPPSVTEAVAASLAAPIAASAPAVPAAEPEDEGDTRIIFRSPSFQAESGGARIRSTFTKTAATDEKETESAVQIPVPEHAPQPQAPQAVSSRIKSTMGKHR